MEYIQIVMIREHLDAFPRFALPDGFAMRAFGPGDRETWVDLHLAAELYVTVSGELFDREFGHDLPAMPRRCCFLLSPTHRDIGTITGWYDRSYRGRRWGRIHWVAIVPGFQGRGLSKPMMTFAMDRLRSLGHRRAMLTTQPQRLAAIRTYLNFGFSPDMTAPDAQRGWTLVRRRLAHPALDRILG